APEGAGRTRGSPGRAAEGSRGRGARCGTRPPRDATWWPRGLREPAAASTTPHAPEKLRADRRPGSRARPAARAIVRFRPVPSIHPFRALRYSREVVDDLSTVVAPPYDVIRPR